MPRLNSANNAESILTADINSTVSDMFVEDISVFPDPPFRVTVDAEIMEVTQIDRQGSELRGIIRGMEGTTATSHAAGAVVQNRFTAGTLEELAGVQDIQRIDTEIDKAKVRITGNEDAITEVQRRISSDHFNYDQRLGHMQQSIDDNAQQINNLYTPNKHRMIRYVKDNYYHNDKGWMYVMFPEIEENVGITGNTVSQDIAKDGIYYIDVAIGLSQLDSTNNVYIMTRIVKSDSNNNPIRQYTIDGRHWNFNANITAQGSIVLPLKAGERIKVEMFVYEQVLVVGQQDQNVRSWLTIQEL